MEAAKKLQLYFIGLQREDEPTNAELLKKVFMFNFVMYISKPFLDMFCETEFNSLVVCVWKDIAVMEEELKVKNELIKKQEKLIQGWRKELQDQLEQHKIELERV